MSLPHAILGFLNQYHPMTGYDLKTQSFDVSVAHFWPADQAQIYRTLDKLSEQGFIGSTLEIQEDRPNRKIYHITEAGRQELDRWLHKVQPLPAYRDSFLVQLFFAQELSNAEILVQLQVQLEAHRARLATYNSIDVPEPESMPLEYRRSIKLAQMTLDFGKQIEHATLEWLLNCMEKLSD